MTLQTEVFNEEQCLKQFGYEKHYVEMIRNTFFKGVSLDNLKVFLHVCRHTGLDPILRQIYPVMRKGQMTIQTSIDGYRLIAERTGKYSPGRESTYCYDKEGRIIYSTAYVKKMTPDGTWHEVGATAYFNELNPMVGPFWQKMPHVMISKCAEAAALRKCFPAQLSGTYIKEEMDQAGTISEYEDITNEKNKDKNHIPTDSESRTTSVHDRPSPNNISIEQDQYNIETPKISKEQIFEITDILGLQSDSLQDLYLNTLQKKFGSRAISNIPATEFLHCKNGLLMMIEKEKYKQTKAVSNEPE